VKTTSWWLPAERLAAPSAVEIKTPARSCRLVRSQLTAGRLPLQL